MTLTPARRTALSVLRRVREREAFGPETLDAVLRAGGLQAADTALATRLTYGTLQTLGTLDEAIDRFADRPERIEPAVRDALRIAVYELLFLRTPARAAVHEGVEAVKSVRKEAAGLANAVLRKVATAAASFPWGDPDTDDAALARLTGHPLWLVNAIVGQYGREAAAEMLRAGSEQAPLYLWVNPFKTSFVEAMDLLEQEGAEPVAEILPGSIRADRPSAAVRSRAVAEGLVLITDLAAQFAPIALAPGPGSAVLDAASGRGTKTVQIQASCVAAGAACDLYALDVHPFKADVLRRRMADLGVPSVTALVGDAADVLTVEGLPSPGSLDAVLLDAPCSGLGTLRRHPEKRWRITAEDVDRLGGIQLELLRSVSALVRAGGRVVYSTCSVARAENHDVVGKFLMAEDGRFTVADIGPLVPDAWRPYLTAEGFFQSLPRTGGPDGHFVAVLERVR